MTAMTFEYKLFLFILSYGPVTIRQVETQMGMTCGQGSHLDMCLSNLLATGRIVMVGNNGYRVTTDHGRLQSE